MNPAVPELSKSDLMAFRQCPKRLWLEKSQPELATQSADAQRRAQDGNVIGKMAREALGSDLLWVQAQESHQLSAAVGKAALNASPAKSAVEFPMFAKGVYARADALVRDGQGYVLQETKGSKYPLKKDKKTTDKPDAHLLEDVAVQTWVARNSGIPVVRSELNLIDGSFVYQGNADYSGFFRQLDVTEVIEPLVEQVPQWVEKAQAILLQNTIPVVPMGRQCKNPHDCPYMAQCQKHEDSGKEKFVPISILPDKVGKDLAARLQEEGFTELRTVSADKLAVSNPKTTKLHQRIQAAHITGQPQVERGVAGVLQGVPYPRYYFDFEGIDLVVPRWTGLRPMEQVTFQWSCHVQREPGGVFEHHEFLDVSGADPTLACLKAMEQVIPDDGAGAILVYYAGYEVSRLKEMAERHPAFRAHVDGWIARVVDLHPIVKEHYYHPKMLGSFSIKQVLKAIAPQLDYANLEGVHNGTEAQLAYLQVVDGQISKAQREKTVQNMLSYCGQDTWAMVEVVLGLVCASHKAKD